MSIQRRSETHFSFSWYKNCKQPGTIEDYIIKQIDFSFPDTKDANASIDERVFFLVSRQKDSIIVIADMNKNLDFTDDDLFMYPVKKNDSFNLPYLRLQHPQTESLYFNFQPYPYLTPFVYNAEKEQKFYLMIKSYEYKTAKEPVAHFSLSLISNKPSPIVEDPALVSITIGNEKDSMLFKRMGESFSLGNIKYLLSGINKSNDTLTLVRENENAVLWNTHKGKPFRPCH